METFYMPQAAAQSYYPVYGLSSASWPQFLAGTFSKSANTQFAGAVGIGWAPDYDVNSSDDPGGSPAAASCKKALQAAGVEAGAGRDNYCDDTFFIQTVLSKARSMTVDGVRAAVEGLGAGGFSPVATFSTFFGPGRYDGPSSLRYLAFEASCTCFRYRGTLRPLP
jgi:hypothetical protein